MSAEPYTPGLDEVRLAYIDRKDFEAQLNRSWADEGAARAEFDRFVAKIRAEALREAAEQIGHKQHPESVRQMLRRRADRIEEEA